MRLYTPPRAKLVPPQATRVFKGIIYDTYQWEQELFDGSKTTFEMLKRPDTVRILAVVDDKVVIIKQEQPHVGLFIDIPGGFHDKEGETELDAAKRELKEETGIECKKWKLIEAVQAHNKIEQFNYLFLAFGAVDGNTLESRKQKLDIGERVEVTYLSLEESKKICDDPIVRFLPKNILNKVNSIEELKALPSLIELH
jgi:ADP-ribose pyrophosphatase